MLIGLLIIMAICIDVVEHKELNGDIYWSQFVGAILELLIFDPLVAWLIISIV